MAYSIRAGSTYTPELLESRRLLSGAFVDLNISRTPGNQAEGAITVDRADPSKLVAVSNIDVGDGLLLATSSDGGENWSHREIADDTDGLPPACCDPSAAFDAFGNLFLAYLNSNDDRIELLLSTDAGNTFTLLNQYKGNVDQPTVAAGPASIWLTFDRNNGVAITGASVTGLGSIGGFQPLRQLPGSSGGDFGDIAVGPTGQVVVTYQKDSDRFNSTIFVNVNSRGVGASFSKAIAATRMHVSNFDLVPAQPKRGIDSEAGLAIDRSGGPFNGRVYLVYSDQLPVASDNTDIFLRYSDNGGATWSRPIRVNDDTGINSQILPRIAIDNTTGQVAVGWYDARYDLGAGGAEDLDNTPNNDVEYFAAVVTPAADGLHISPNLRISNGPSNAADANGSIDLGDYTGLDFYNGVVHPLWFDNSNSTGDNPNGTHRMLNDYTANAPGSAFMPGPLWLGGTSAPSGPLALLYSGGGANPGVTRGRSYTITALYADAAGFTAASIGSATLQISGPGDFSASARLLRARPRRGGRQWQATYRITRPFTRAADGTYTITLLPNQLTDTLRRPAPSGILGSFVVYV